VTGAALTLSGVPKYPRTLGEVAVRNILAQNGAGKPSLVAQARAAKQAADALTVAVALAISAYRNDGDYSQKTYATWWEITDRTAQRDWESFRRAFPGEQTPQRVAERIVAEYGQRMAELEPRAGLSLPADVLPA
jgi:hypothetical protein